MINQEREKVKCLWISENKNHWYKFR